MPLGAARQASEDDAAFEARKKESLGARLSRRRAAQGVAFATGATSQLKGLWTSDDKRRQVAARETQRGDVGVGAFEWELEAERARLSSLSAAEAEAERKALLLKERRAST